MLIVVSLLVSALPSYLRPLPWVCKEGAASVANGSSLDLLAECRPNGTKPDLQKWVQKVADAMGHAGLAPRLRFGPLGPHLYGLDKKATVSATFVTAPNGDFNVWVSVQRFGAPPLPMPELPAGAEVVADHSQEDGQRLVSIHLRAPAREASGILDATLHAMGARALGREDTERGGKAGRLFWQGQTGHYVLEPSDNGSYLNLFIGAGRER